MIERIIAFAAACLVFGGLYTACRQQPPVATPAQIQELKLVTKSYKVRGKRYVPMDANAALRYKEEGIASFFEGAGSRGALGERMKRGEFYAAHPTLPMPCRVRITSLSNGRSCEARIVDRGPFSRGRIIDVSSAVARELDFTRKGLERVRVEVISVGDGPHRLMAE